MELRINLKPKLSDCRGLPASGEVAAPLILGKNKNGFYANA
jgi:hypothetical protein